MTVFKPQRPVQARFAETQFAETLTLTLNPNCGESGIGESGFSESGRHLTTVGISEASMIVIG